MDASFFSSSLVPAERSLILVVRIVTVDLLNGFILGVTVTADWEIVVYPGILVPSRILSWQYDFDEISCT